MRALEAAADGVLRRFLGDKILRGAGASPQALRAFWQAQPKECRESPRIKGARNDAADELKLAKEMADRERRRRAGLERALEHLREENRRLKETLAGAREGPS
jgi:uncharacterized protein HemY